MVRVMNSFWNGIQILILLSAVVCFLSLFSLVWAQVGTAVASGETVMIDAHGECRQVSHTDAGTRMVFTGTAPEWQSFINNPSGLNMEACALEDANCLHDTWIPRASNQRWNAIASSSDGSKLVAAVLGGRIYTSSDGGGTWSARASSQDWSGLASSADGTKLAAVGYNTPVYTSTDSGVTWVARGTNRQWTGIASSADGKKLVAVASYDNAYTSTDSGVTWTPRVAGDFQAVASSADGAKLIATEGNGYIYTSSDSGVTWAKGNHFGSWLSAASSADGAKLIVGDYGGQLYTSNDSGATWVERKVSGFLYQGNYYWDDHYWQGVASSANGKTLAAVDSGGGIYTSGDAGETWHNTYLSATWNVVASSNDGSKLVVGAYGERIYTSTCSVSCETGPVGTVCEDGAIYAGSVGGKRFYVAPSDEVSTSWNAGNAQWSVTGITSRQNGKSNTDALEAFNGAGSPHKAAQLCKSKGSGWYLPAVDELIVIYNNRDVLGTFDMSNPPASSGEYACYWSSTEYSNTYGYCVKFATGTTEYGTKGRAFSVRCARH